MLATNCGLADARYWRLTLRSYLTEYDYRPIEETLRIRGNLRLGGIPDVEAAIDSIPDALSAGPGSGISITPDSNNPGVELISVASDVARRGEDNDFGSSTSTTTNTFHGSFNVNLVDDGDPDDPEESHTATITSRNNQSIGLQIDHGEFLVTTTVGSDIVNSLRVEQPGATEGDVGALEVGVPAEFSSSLAVGNGDEATSIDGETILVDNITNDTHSILNSTRFTVYWRC